MISFKQFLFEEEFRKIKGLHDSYYAEHKIDDSTTVGVKFTRHESNPNIYHTDFNINGSIDAPKNSTNNSHKSLFRVAHTIRRFVANKKPTHLIFAAADKNEETRQHKHNLYGKLANHFATKHGAKLHSTDSFHVLEF